MQYSYLILSLLPALVVSQTAPQFVVQVQNNLPVTYEASNTEVTPPGVLLPRNGSLYTPCEDHV
jgi:hypothetical protein